MHAVTVVDDHVVPEYEAGTADLADEPFHAHEVRKRRPRLPGAVIALAGGDGDHHPISHGEH